MALRPTSHLKTVVEKTNKSSRNSVRTDLGMLLECLKLQMKCPDLQKQALLTIHSICENREDNVDLLREMGGVAFVYCLSRSSIVHSDVKETALFTLSTLAEANVFCKNFLCREETFTDLAGYLMTEAIPLSRKRVSVYLLSVLVANNKSGQSLAQTTGCLDILLDLFRTIFPLSKDATSMVANATHINQLWASVSSALCGCVNNPQNEDGQSICAAAFPIINIWLQQISLTHTDIYQSVCSFISMTVANNSDVQETFSASGGLESLSLSLLRLASVADSNLLSCHLSMIISKTLSACITDNSALASGLAQYEMVSILLSLLASPYLDTKDTLSVLLTLGHCTEASEEHQSQLVQCGGLPLIITILTEDTSEEVRKAAAFILQTCKQATMPLGEPPLVVTNGDDRSLEPLKNMESFRTSARELLCRISLLEQAKEAEDEAEDERPPLTTEGLILPPLSTPLALPLQHEDSMQTIPTAYRQTTTYKNREAASVGIKPRNIRKVNWEENAYQPQHMGSDLITWDEKAKTSEIDNFCSMCKCPIMFSHEWSLEGGRDPHTAESQLFKPPATVSHSTPKDVKSADAGLQDWVMSKVKSSAAEEHAPSHSRCAGNLEKLGTGSDHCVHSCVLPFGEVTSRTFASLQSSCHYSCDMHKALQAATEQFRTRHSHRLPRRENMDDKVSAAKPRRSQEYWSEVTLIPTYKGARKVMGLLPEHHWGKRKGINLTPLHKGARKETFNSYKSERRGRKNSGHSILDDDEPKTSTGHCSSRGNFCHEEVCRRLSGVKRFGLSWQSILWSYPFHPGRTSMDLAKKYRLLMTE